MTVDTAGLLAARRRELAALYRGHGLPQAGGEPLRVAVVGAGLAGLTAAHLLAAANCEVTVYEASDRVGGRIRTEVRGASHEVWELGGEFIDSAHDDMHALADVFGLAMLDTLPAAEEQFATAYRFGGQAYSPDQVAAALAELAPRLAADVASLHGRPGLRNAGDASRRLDRMSIADYLYGLGLDRWLHQLIEVAYVTVYGGEAAEQSALNLLTLVGTDPHAPEIFGDSDERFKLLGGSQGLTDAMAQRLGPRITLGRRLARLRRAASDWKLEFESGAAARADAVVLAVPFTLLRQVDLGDLLPPAKRQAVDTLGYGSNAKLLFGTRRRVWREQGFDGGCYTDTALQSSWDCSRLRGGEGGVFTVYLGGEEGRALGRGEEADHAARYAALGDQLFPGFAADRDGQVRRVCWVDEPFALGSYTCYRPGQWTAFGGVEGEPLPGGLCFAGEHCAGDSQGYMNGAAETGRLAALEILRCAR